MEMNKSQLVSLLLMVTFSTFATAAPLTDEQIRTIGYTYPTPFGDLEFYDEKGELGVMSAKLVLDSKPFLVPSSLPDGWGNTLSLMPMDRDALTAVDRFPRDGKKLGRRMTKRLIVAEGPDGNCIRQFIILDFTLDKPFISKRFGDNPDMKHCLSFKSAKWGAEKSRITLGDGNYIYRTGADITLVEGE